MSAWWFVFRKELRETLRDRRTLLVMLAVPVLLYPVLMVASEQLLLFGMRQLDEEAAPVAVLGDAPSDLLWILDSIPTLRVVPPPAVGGSAPRSTMEESIREALTEGSVAAVVVLEGPTDGFGSREVRVYYSDASDRSRRGRSELMGAVDLWGGRLLEERLRVQGLPRSFVVPVAVADTSLALPEEVGGYALGRMLPMLLIVITLLGTFYPAIDLAAGEKERGTLEALLTTPVPPGAVVTGKFVTVALVGVVAAALNLLSMLLTFRTGLFRLAAEAGMVAAIAPATVALIFLTLIPLAVLFGALFLGISVRTASFKEAQNSLTPVYMLVMIPALLPVFPGIDLTPLLAVTPVAGVALFFRDLMSGVADPLMGAVVLVSSGVYAVLALRFAARNFGREDVLFPASRAPRSRRRPRGLGPVAALVNASGSGIPGERAAAGFIAVVA
ncbi:MAG: ABC transporter permease subunit, partial [Gemmatimonadota bacterium]|nr:ABC transporter permease subunit [Gemmatimonadota bacterium]